MFHLLLATFGLFLALHIIPFIVASVYLAGYSVVMSILGLLIKVKEFFNVKQEG